MPTSLPISPQLFRFADDGRFPNSRLPVLLYRGVAAPAGQRLDDWLEGRFVHNNWRGIWRNGILTYHHYHSTSHEVLGIYDGSAEVLLGGPAGQRLTVQSGDVLVIPAGVAHQNVRCSPDFAVIGGYPDGRSWDLLRGDPGERPAADERIGQLPLPTHDPLYGSAGPLMGLWIA